MIPLRDVSPEDLEEGDPLLDNNSSSSSSKIKPKDYISANFENSSFRDDELLSYINRHTNSTPGFRNYFNNFLHNIFNTNTLSTNTLWVERTPGFFPIRLNQNNIQVSTDKTGEHELSLESYPNSSEINDYEDQSTNQLSMLSGKSLKIPPTPTNIPGLNREKEKAEQNWEEISIDYRSFIFTKRIIYLVIQGYVSGLTAITVINSSNTDKLELLFESYQPFSQELRLALFLLLSLSFIGALDYILSQYDLFTSPRNPYYMLLTTDAVPQLKSSERSSIICGMFLCILTTITYVTSYIMARFDTILGYKCGYEDYYDTNNNNELVSWTQQCIDDPYMKSEFDNWKTLNVVRFVTMLLSWLICCYLLLLDTSRYSELWFSLRKMRKSALGWMKRSKALEGEITSSNVSVDDLREIVQTLEISLQRTRNALNFLQRDKQS